MRLKCIIWLIQYKKQGNGGSSASALGVHHRLKFFKGLVWNPYDSQTRINFIVINKQRLQCFTLT